MPDLMHSSPCDSPFEVQKFGNKLLTELHPAERYHFVMIAIGKPARKDRKFDFRTLARYNLVECSDGKPFLTPLGEQIWLAISNPGIAEVDTGFEHLLIIRYQKNK